MKNIKPFREPLGKLIERKLKSTQYTTTAPGAPDGQYVIIQFNTSFENKKNAVETVTPMKDKDGKWRVSGYYIKQGHPQQRVARSVSAGTNPLPYGRGF